MTKEDLEQLGALKNEIVILQRELDHLEFRQERKAYVYGVYNLIDGSYERMERLKQRKRAKMEAFATQVEKIETFIDNIDDSLTRQIFRLRYIEGMRWLPIAFAVGYADEQRPRKRHDNYLQVQGIAV